MKGNAYDIYKGSLLVNNKRLNIWKTQLILENPVMPTVKQTLGLKGLKFYKFFEFNYNYLQKF